MMKTSNHKCTLCRVALKNVQVKMGQDVLLKDISFHIHCGAITALIGPNGAGKTTLIKALLKEVPFEGAIKHEDAQGRQFENMRTGYVPQHMPFDKQMPVTVLDFMCAAFDKAPVWLSIKKSVKKQAIEALQIAHAESLANKRLGALSGGELQRVLLALALKPVPDLLVLDEPVSGVDQNGLKLFFDTVKQLTQTHHMAILLVSHDLEQIKAYADTVVLLDKEVRAIGAPQEVFESQAFKDMFPVLGGVL